MAGPGGESTADVAARDDAHLRSFRIKPELRRTLGFLSNFAIAFAFISVSTGTFGNYGIGIGLSGPAFYWTWFIVIGGQLLVALVLRSSPSHYPVAGSLSTSGPSACRIGRSAGSPAGSTCLGHRS